MLDEVMLGLLADDDGRVRHAAAHALSRVVPQLFYAVDNLQHDPVIARAKDDTSQYLDPIMYEWSQPPQSSIHGLATAFSSAMLHNGSNNTAVIESSLSRVVSSLIGLLNMSFSRHLTVSFFETY